MKVRRRGGRLTLSLGDHEVDLLQSLLDQLAAVLDDSAGLDPDDPVLDRLFPSAYRDDAAAETDYRDMTESTLRAERIDRIAACSGELALAGDGAGTVELADPDVSRRWIQVLNDLRLALGTRLDVRDDGPPELDPTDPEAQPWLIYHWLTALQDTVVTALMR